jgi:hypothetical protein
MGIRDIGIFFYNLEGMDQMVEIWNSVVGEEKTYFLTMEEIQSFHF